MRLKLKYADKIVGAFMFTAFFIFFGLIILILVNQKIFIKKYNFRTRFDNRIGLNLNQDIFYKGFKIGKITKYTLNELPDNVDYDYFENYFLYNVETLSSDQKDTEFVMSNYYKDPRNGKFRLKKGLPNIDRIRLLVIFENIGYTGSVDAEFVIFGKYLNFVRRDSVLLKALNPITSGATVTLIPNMINRELTSEWGYIYSLDTKEGQLVEKRGEIKKQSDSISNIITSVDELLSSINSDRNADQNSVARILVNTADSVEILKDQMTKFNTILDNFQELSYQMKNPDGMVKRLVDPDGTYMFNSIQTSLNNLTNILAELDDFSKFLNGESTQIETLLYQSKSTLKEAKDVLEGIKNNPLIKGGIPQKKEQDPIKDNKRERDFK